MDEAVPREDDGTCMRQRVYVHARVRECDELSPVCVRYVK